MNKKEFLFSIFLFLCCCGQYAHAQSVFQRVYLDPNYLNCAAAYGLTILQTDDSGFVVGGVPANNNFDSTTLIKISSAGGLEWRYAPAYYATSLAELSNGDIVALCGAIKISKGTQLAILSSGGSLKIDTVFSLQDDTEGGVSLIADADSVVVVSAKSDSLIVRKIGPDGHILWLTKLPGKEIETGSGYPHRSLIQRKDDYLVVSDSEVFSLDQSGSVIWQKVFRLGIVGIRSVGINGEFAIQILSPSSSILHCDSSGAVRDSIFSTAIGFVPVDDGYVVTGFGGNQATGSVAIIASSVGWSKGYASPPKHPDCGNAESPGGGWNGGVDIIHTFDGGYAVAGIYDAPTSEGPAPGGAGIYVIKTDGLGNTDSLEIDTIRAEPGNSVSLSSHPEFSLQIYPAPTTSRTALSFTLPVSGVASLTLTDAAGREIPLLHSSWMDVGQHEVTWDASEYPSGVYLCRLTSGGESVTRRVVVMH